MKQKKFSIMLLTGVMLLAVAPVWSQDAPGGSGPAGAPSGSGPEGQPPATERQPGTTERQPETKGAEGMKGEALSMDEVKKVQQALKERGHDPGPINGVLGSQTREAIKAYQASKGLQATGNLDDQTAKELGVGKAGRESPGATGGRPESSQKGPESSPMGKDIK